MAPLFSLYWVRERMRQVFKMKRVAFCIAFVVILSVGVVSAAPPYPTTPATATVDGDPSEWDLTDDFFADMYRAGDPTKVVQSKLYLRYDPSTSTLYVLVLTEADYPGLRESDEAWVKIDGTKMVDGSYADFEWIEFPAADPYYPTYVNGFEASFTLGKGEYTLDAHINVYSINEEKQESQTSRVVKTGLDLFVIPEGSTILLISGTFLALGLFAYKRRKK
jgi:hypothetical protein